MNAHDAARARAMLPDDFVFEDHRRTGLGRIGNAGDYVASLAALWEESPDAFAETLYYVAQNERASLNVGRTSGTLRSGGAFESLFVRLGRFEGGRFVGAELFEVDDLPRARARLVPAYAVGGIDVLSTRGEAESPIVSAAKDVLTYNIIAEPNLQWPSTLARQSREALREEIRLATLRMESEAVCSSSSSSMGQTATGFASRMVWAMMRSMQIGSDRIEAFDIPLPSSDDEQAGEAEHREHHLHQHELPVPVYRMDALTDRGQE